MISNICIGSRLDAEQVQGCLLTKTILFYFFSTNDLDQQHSPPAASTSARSAPAQSDPNQVTKSTPAFKVNF